MALIGDPYWKGEMRKAYSARICTRSPKMRIPGHTDHSFRVDRDQSIIMALDITRHDQSLLATEFVFTIIYSYARKKHQKHV